MKKGWMGCMLWCLLCLVPIAAWGMEAADITQGCRITASEKEKNLGRLMDRSSATVWESEKTKQAELMITLPEGTGAGGLYLCWSQMPARWTLWELGESGWEAAGSGDAEGFAHIYVPLSEQTQLRLTMENDRAAKVSISELYVLSPGDMPGWVQQWQPAPKRADLLVLVAHPDDEHLYMGGTLPYYAGERKLQVAVAYMTCGTNQRRTELLNGLWKTGVRQYPVIGAFRDKRYDSMEKVYELWGRNKARGFVVELYRRFKPLVVVSHDVNGEYGHGAHKVCASAARYALEAAADPKLYPQSAEAYGLWNLPKLYLHLYRKNAVVMDWRVPLKAFEGKTAFDMAEAGYGEHLSQHKYEFRVRDEGAYNCAKFGLVRSLVGPDEGKKDFFENVDGFLVPGGTHTGDIMGDAL